LSKTFIDSYMCVKCGSAGSLGGELTLDTRCPRCNSIYVVPTKVLVLDRGPQARRKKFKVLTGGKSEKV
jgi:DNA-directed RNA polymerase subunit RPC12/RpoP